MKLFISLQVLIVISAVIAGCVISSDIPDVGFDGINRIEDIKKTNCDVITTAEATGAELFRAFEDGGWMYDETYSTAVFVCRAENSYKFANDLYSQKVTIEKQLKGICPKVGESIILTIKGGFGKYPKEMYPYNEQLPEKIPSDKLLNILNLGGLNFMKPGHSYLVACQTRTLGPVRYYGMPYGAACWLDLAENHDRIITEPFGEADYLKYTDNEFFCQSEKMLDNMLSRKAEIFDRFGL